MKRFLLFFIYSGAFIIGVVLSSIILSKILLREKALVRVPDVKGKELIDAWQILKRESLELKINYFRYSEVVPRYVIIEQKPLGGEKIEKNRSVFVVLSLGPQRFFIPEFIGLNLEGAKRLIEDSGLILKGVLKIRSPKGEDEIIGQYPPPDSEAPLRDVSLLLSTASPKKDFISPDLIGMRIEDLQSILSSYGIPLKIKYIPPNVGEPYRAFQQFPEVGMKISTDGGIEVVVPGMPAEGMVLKIGIPYGFLKKFLEITINYGDWEMALFRDMVEGGRTMYLFVPGNERIEVFLDKKRISVK